MTRRLTFVLALAATAGLLPRGLAAAPPGVWEPRGVGGGGALYAPSLSPHVPDRLYVACDMSELFRSDDLGRSWSALDFRQIQGNHEARVQFTPDPSVLYSIDYTVLAGLDLRRPSRSTDGGATWIPLPNDPTGGDAWSLNVDPADGQRLLVGDYRRLFLSTDGGQSFAERWSVASDAGLLVGGVFWDGSLILAGTSDGLLVSSNGGASFARAAVGGIPAGQAILSFAGAKQAGTRRLYAVAGEAASMYNGITGADHGVYRGVYVLDWGQPAWTLRVSGIAPGDHPFFVGAPLGDIGWAFLGGGGDAGVPTVYRTMNGGQGWQSVLGTAGNANVVTGWSGQGGDRGWGYGECALGFAVSPLSAARIVITDYGFVHVSEDGGGTWRQAYVAAADEHPAGLSTPPRRTYRSIGLENTTAWSLAWSGPNDLFAGYSDIRGMRSADGGASWSFDYAGHTQNSMYRVVRAGDGLYGATSTVHDLYQSTYLTDSRIDGGDGGVLYSADAGRTWQLLHDFNHPVIWVTPDPAVASRVYASVVHSTQGGIYVTDNAHLGSGSTWTRLASPPRTEGHPFNLHVLADGTLVATYSGRRNGSGSFTASSGVFVSTDGGASWADRSDPGMLYWTKDLAVDPHDPAQATWYAGVFSGWGGPPNGLGGLYRTRNRGLSWTRIHTADRVGSATVSPVDPDELYFTTEVDGLWHTSSLGEAAPVFVRTTYPFRQPERVFFNPFDAAEVWVTSFGNGLRVGRAAPSGPSSPVARYRLYHDGTKEHFYTTDLNEYLVLGTRGWMQEGIAHRVLDGPGPYAGFTPIPCYRFYHPGIQQHFWTTDAYEASVLASGGGWITEGVDGYLLPPAAGGAGSGAGAVPLYRMAYAYLPLHLWTTDAYEYSVLPALGWIPEGVIGYVLP